MARPPYELVNCPHCQAVADAIAGDCWLCGERLDKPRRLTRTRRSETQSSAKQSIGRSGVVAPVALCMVLIGVFLIAPGLGLIIAMCAAPCLLRSGAEDSLARKAIQIVAIAGLVLLGIFVAAFVLCIAVVSRGGNPMR